MLFLISVWANNASADAPYIDPADDETYFGDVHNMLFWTLEEKVSGFRNMDRLRVTRKVEASDSPSLLPTRDVESRDFQFEYDGQTYSLDDYVRRHNVAGLLVIKD
jgi:hypothetical protein